MTTAEDSRRWAIEGLVRGLEQMKVALGPAAGAVLDEVRAELTRAMAERDRGDRRGAVSAVARAMAKLAELGDDLDASEGEMMRALTAEFVKGIDLGDEAGTEASLGRIQQHAGTPAKGSTKT